MRVPDFVLTVIVTVSCKINLYALIWPSEKIFDFQTHTTTYVTVTSPPTLVRLWVNRLCDKVFYFIHWLEFFRA